MKEWVAFSSVICLYLYSGLPLICVEAYSPFLEDGKENEQATSASR